MRSLAVITALLLASIAFPAGAQEPTYAGRTAAEWQAIAALIPPPPPGCGQDVLCLIDEVSRKWGVNPSETSAIAKCESGYQTGVVSRTGDYGLMQHSGRYAAPRFAATGYNFQTDWADPKANLEAAMWYRHRIGRWGGSSGWACARIVGLY